MEDRQLSVLASGKGTLISHLCEPEQRGHNINEGLVIVPIIIAMSKRLNWMMKRGSAGTASTFYNYAHCQKQTFNFCIMNHSDLISVDLKWCLLFTSIYIYIKYLNLFIYFPCHMWFQRSNTWSWAEPGWDFLKALNTFCWETFFIEDILAWYFKKRAAYSTACNDSSVILKRVSMTFI